MRKEVVLFLWECLEAQYIWWMHGAVLCFIRDNYLFSSYNHFFNVVLEKSNCLLCGQLSYEMCTI